MTENTNKKRNNKKKKKPVISIIIIVIAALVFVFAAYKLITIHTEYQKSADSYDAIREILKSGDTAAEESTDISIDDIDLKTEYEDEYDEGMVWNYSALKAVNSDTIGYIKARGDGAIVDYPVVQCSDNDYYIHRLFDGTANNAGTLFMDCSCINGFYSSYAIIYGHNMASGSRMFGYLKQYENSDDYYAGHTEYDVYAGTAHYVYKVFAVFKTDTDSLVYNSPAIYSDAALTSEEREQYIQDLAEYSLNNSVFETGYQLSDFNSKSHILALSTCYGDGSDPSRWIVMLVRDRVVISRPES